MRYKVTNPDGGQLWRYPAMNIGGKMPFGAEFDSDVTVTVKNNACRMVQSGTYADGKNACEASDTSLVVVEPPVDPPPAGDTLTIQPGDMQIVMTVNGVSKTFQNAETAVFVESNG